MTREFELVPGTEKEGEKLRVHVTGSALLRAPLLNKGTAFTEEERSRLGLHGLLPPAHNSLAQQVERAYVAYRELSSPMGRYRFLRALQDRQEILFCALVAAHLQEMMPIVYTPTVGEAIQRYSTDYQEPRGLAFSSTTIAHARELTANHAQDDVRLLVATDSSAILGIGDQGHGGLAIAIGKLALYAVGGLSPYLTVPVGLDVGTDRADLLADPMYLGVRHKRLRGEEYFAFLDAFVDAVRARWPRAVVQWEDFGKDAAFSVLERYRKVLPSFNDDIQGTGAVALAGLVNACRLRGEKLSEQRVVVHGAGAGGVGVAMAIHSGMMREGLTAEEAHARIFVTDSKGLLTRDRDMEAYKRAFAQPSVAGGVFGVTGRSPNLLETVRGAKATVLIGLSGVPKSFDEPIVRAMLEHTKSPVVFPLSNPTTSCEATPAEVLAWSQGRAIVATGSPFDPVDVNGKSVSIGQGNNAFIFPGLGLGAVIAEAREISDGMALEAAYALADLTAERWPDRVYPPIDALQDASHRVAVRVVEAAVKDGVAGVAPKSRAEIEALVAARFWTPKYLPVETSR
jgi:malate dehydrogenase (oxaloacetate-decarboxylating)